MGSFSIWHWLIVLVIVLLIFGTKKLRNMGADLGGAVRGFKDGMREGGDKDGGQRAPAPQISRQDGRRRSQGQDRAQGLEPAPRDEKAPAAPFWLWVHVRHRIFRAPRDRRRRAGRHRPRERCRAWRAPSASVRPPAALRVRRQGGHQPRDRARRAAQDARPMQQAASDLQSSVQSELNQTETELNKTVADVVEDKTRRSAAAAGGRNQAG